MSDNRHNSKSIEYIKLKSYTNYDPRWIKGHIEKYIPFFHKKPDNRIYTEKKSIIKYYQIENENNKGNI